MKQVIVDYTPFNVSATQINESMKENNGKLIVKGVLQRAEAKNQNGRVYPRDILVRESKKYNENFVSQNRALGELDHPDSQVINLKNVSHNINSIWWDGDNIENLINSGEQQVAYDGCDFDNTYYSTIVTSPSGLTESLCSINFQFVDSGVAGANRNSPRHRPPERLLGR